MRTGKRMLSWLMVVVLLSLVAVVACASGFDLDAELARIDATPGPGLAAMVLDRGEVVYQSVHGLADVPARRPISAQTPFRLASVSKQFVAMAILLLAEDGELDLDAPVRRYLPELEPYGDSITVRHLVHHTGGLPDYYDALTAASGDRYPTNVDAAKLLGASSDVKFPAGSQYAYSNPGYEMLGLIIERVSGQRFRTFLTERIFVPLGMKTATVYDDTRPTIPGRVLGYRIAGNEAVELDDHSLNHILGAGGIYASLDDLRQWSIGLDQGKLLPADAWKTYFAPATLTDGSATDYAFGWGVDSWEGHVRHHHSGAWVGFRTYIARLPEEGLTAVVLANRLDVRPGQVATALLERHLEGRAAP